MRSKDAEGMANSVDPDQEQSDLNLHCLLKSICPKQHSFLLKILRMFHASISSVRCTHWYYSHTWHYTHPGNGQLVRRRRTIEEQVDQFR